MSALRLPVFALVSSAGRRVFVAARRNRVPNFREESAMSRFILGDCVQVMSRFPPRAVDFILTDPPYLVGSAG